jgi:hypothetical protein
MMNGHSSILLENPTPLWIDHTGVTGIGIVAHLGLRWVAPATVTCAVPVPMPWARLLGQRRTCPGNIANSQGASFPGGAIGRPRGMGEGER